MKDKRKLLQFYKKSGITKMSDLSTPKPIHLNDLYYPDDVVVHQLIFWAGGNYPDGVYLKRFNKKPYHLNIVEPTYLPVGGKMLNKASELAKEERKVPDVTPLVNTIESFSDRPTIVNYSNLSRNIGVRSKGNLGQLERYDAVIHTMINKVKEVSRKTEKPQYIYFNLTSTGGLGGDGFLKLFRLNPTMLAKELKSFEAYIEFTLAAWFLKGAGPMRALGNIDDVYIITKVGNLGYVFLSQLIHTLTQDINFEIDDEFGVSGIKYATDSSRLGMLSNILNAIKLPPGEIVPTKELDTEGEFVEEVVAPEPMVINYDAVTTDEVPDDPIDRVNHHIEDLLKEPLVNEADIVKYERSLKKNANVEMDNVPLSALTTVKGINVKRKKLIEQLSTIKHSSMTTSVLPRLDSHYINNVLETHMYKVLNAFSPSGLVLTGVKRKVFEDITGGYIEYKATFDFVGGGTSSETIRIPKVDEEGVFLSGNTKFRLRRQQVDQPYRKINSKRVALNSYTGTLFLEGPLLAVDDYVTTFARRIKAVELESDYIIIRNNAYNPNVEIDDGYSRISKIFETITRKSDKLFLNFNYRKRVEIGDVKKFETKGHLLVGKTGNQYITVKDSLYYKTRDGKANTLIGDIFDVMGIKGVKKPTDVATIKILGARVYVGMLLAYLYGITGLLKRLKVKYKVYPPRQRVDVAERGELLLKFKNGQLHMKDLDKSAVMILQGLVKFQSKIKDVNYSQLDDREVYLDLMSKDLKVRHIREFNLLDKQYVDPITEEVLTFLKLPTNFRELVIYGVGKLEDNSFPSSAHMRYTRYRGYERLAGAAYNQIYKHLRVANSAVNRRNRKLKMSPFATWQEIMQDDSKKVIEDTNPMVWMKEEEVVTAAGMGGRKSDSLTEEVRKFHPSQVGTVSEFVPDDGNVGMVAYLTTDPNIDNIYGIPKELEHSDITKDFSRNYSSGYMHAAGATFDDKNRVAFISIQNGHTIAMDNMELPYVRTGYEYVIPQRVGKMFVTRSKQAGVVKSKGKGGLIIEHEDGSKTGARLGVQVGTAEGSYYPSDLTTDLKVGDKVEEGDPICWNRKFFERDLFEGRLAYKHTRMAWVMMLEGAITYEDTCSASREFMQETTSDILALHDVTIDFRDEVIDVVKVGQEVKMGEPMMVIQDHATAGADTDKSELRESLLNLTQGAPKFDYDGTVERIEVYYHGDTSLMSESLLALTKESDKVLLKKAADSGSPKHTGSVGIDYRSKGKSLPLNFCEVKIFLNVVNTLTNVGKLVICNQLKTTVGNVEDANYTELGYKVDIKFSRIAADARIVGSFDEVGVLSTCLDLIPPKIEELWKK